MITITTTNTTQTSISAITKSLATSIQYRAPAPVQPTIAPPLKELPKMLSPTMVLPGISWMAPPMIVPSTMALHTMALCMMALPTMDTLGCLLLQYEASSDATSNNGNPKDGASKDCKAFDCISEDSSAYTAPPTRADVAPPAAKTPP